MSSTFPVGINNRKFDFWPSVTCSNLLQGIIILTCHFYTGMRTYFQLYVVSSGLPATGLEELSIQILLGVNQLAMPKNLTKMLSNFPKNLTY